MQQLLLAGLTFVALAASSSSSPAQTNAPGQAPSMESRQRQIIGFLPKSEQDRVINAYNKAITDNPDLKTMQMDLQKQRQDLADGGDDARQAFMDKVNSYQDKLRAAMIKEDAQLGPVLDKIDKHRAEMGANGMQGSAGAGQ